MRREIKFLKTIAFSFALLALPVTAYAQGGGIDRKKDKEESAIDIAKRKADEKQYNNSLSNIAPKQYDPWAGVREKPPAEKPAPVAKKKPPPHVRPFVQ